MKVLKPQRLGLLQRVVQHQRRCTLVVTVLAYVPLDQPCKLLMEMSLWKDLADVLPGGVLDEGNPKPCGEVLVSGSAFAPEGRQASAVMTRLSLEREDSTLIDKKLAILGDRWWAGRKPTEPVVFRQLPLDWSRAFGGEGFSHNPLGKGVCSVDSDHGEVTPLPNIEDPDSLVLSPKDRPAPAGYAAIDLTWPQRVDKLGKDYGGDWLQKYAPGPARDFDPGFYSTAPADQQIDGFFRVLLTQRHGEDDPTTDAQASESFSAHDTRLDTIHFFPDKERAVLVYRASIDVREDDADDIVHLMVAAEDPAAPKPLEHYQRVLALRLDKEMGALASMHDADLMPPQDAGWAVAPDYGDMADMTRLDQRRLQRAERGRKRALEQAKAEMTEAGFDTGDAFDEPEMPEPPDPYDIEALMTFSEEMDRLAAEMQEQGEADRERLEAEARQSFADAGFDYDAEMKKAAEEAGGPPDYCAEEQLLMLHDMARIAAEGDSRSRSWSAISLIRATSRCCAISRSGSKAPTSSSPTSCPPPVSTTRRASCCACACRPPTTSASPWPAKI